MRTVCFFDSCEPPAAGCWVISSDIVQKFKRPQTIRMHRGRVNRIKRDLFKSVIIREIRVPTENQAPRSVSDPGQAVSRILSARTGRAGRGEGHLSYATQPGAMACAVGRAIPGSLFGLAPNGVYRAPLITLGAVGSYPTFSPLPGEPSGLFSVALAVGDALRRRLPRVSRPQGAGYAASCPAEFGLSSPGKAGGDPPPSQDRRTPPSYRPASPQTSRLGKRC